MITEARIRFELDRLESELAKIDDLPDRAIVAPFNGLPARADIARKELGIYVFTLKWVLGEKDSKGIDFKPPAAPAAS